MRDTTKFLVIQCDEKDKELLIDCIEERVDLYEREQYDRLMYLLVALKTVKQSSTKEN